MTENTQDNPASDFFSELAIDHAQILKDSAITPDVAARRGYATITAKAKIKRLGFSERQCRTPCLLIPVWGTSGEIVNYQIRPNNPYIQKRAGKRDKAIKYETVSDHGLCLDIPNDPRVRESLRADGPPIFITEGARKVDSGISHGILTIGVLGVYGWRGRNELGGLTALPDWESIHLKSRVVYLAFDSDARENDNVCNALKRLKRFLESKGADVKVIWMPPASDGSKVGLDDFFAADHSVDELLQHACDEIPIRSEASLNHPYKASDKGIEWVKETNQGTEIIPLTNFNARIVAEAAEDDGTSNTQRVFTIEAKLKDSYRRFDVPAARFSTMQWPIEYIGIGAVVWPGRSEHARCAIQFLSEDIDYVTVYKHTGWREVDGQYFYLYTGGAIGPNGLVSNIKVRLEEELSRITLPNPPEGERLREAIKASLDIIKVSARSITYPLLASVYRVVLGQCDYGIHLAGESGAGKSELAALCQMHFGSTMDARHLPGSWSSTGNALEALAFAAKDALMVIDDFVPTGRAVDIQRQQRDADRIFRGQGNQSGRQRMSADGSIRSTRWVRGLVLSTGEDIPQGQSLRSRVLILEVEKQRGPNIIDWNQLTHTQAAAAEGLYAEAMAGFIRWLAPHYGEVQKHLKQEIIKLRQMAASTGSHKRLPEIIANLTLGLQWFLRFAVASEAITPLEAEVILKDGWAAFGEAASTQQHHQTATEPVALFQKLLSAAVASGAAHIAMASGEAPKSSHEDEEVVIGIDGHPFTPTSWGWRELANGLAPQGTRIGWISSDGQSLYLQPEAAFSVAQQLANKSNEQLTISPRTLWTRLQDRGFLITREKNRRTFTVRRVIEGRSQGVLQVALNFLDADLRDQNADNADSVELNDSQIRIEESIWDVSFLPNADIDADSAASQSELNVSMPVSSLENADIDKHLNGNELQADVSNVSIFEPIEPVDDLDCLPSNLQASLHQETKSTEIENREVRRI